MSWFRWVEFSGQPPCLGGGPSSQERAAEAAQTNASNQLASIAAKSESFNEQQYARSQKLEQPLVDKETALASGDRKAALSAAEPVIGQLQSGYDAAKASIANTIPPGAARDKALAQLEQQRFTGIASAQAAEVEAAPGILAQVGTGAAGLSVQELAGALSGFQSSGQISGQIASEENQAKANQLGFFGDLAGTVGGLAGSFIPKPKPSDIRLKQDFSTLEGTLEKLSHILPVRFRYIGKPDLHIGVIAQHVEEVYPELVRYDERGIRSVDYGALAAVAISAVQELEQKLDRITERMAALERMGVA